MWNHVFVVECVFLREKQQNLLKLTNIEASIKKQPSKCVRNDDPIIFQHCVIHLKINKSNNILSIVFILAGHEGSGLA